MNKRTECNCICHQPGVKAMHVMPCCDGNPKPTEKKWDSPGVVGYSNGMETEFELAWAELKRTIRAAARQDTIDFLMSRPAVWLWSVYPRWLKNWMLNDGNE